MKMEAVHLSKMFAYWTTTCCRIPNHWNVLYSQDYSVSNDIIVNNNNLQSQTLVQNLPHRQKEYYRPNCSSGALTDMIWPRTGSNGGWWWLWYIYLPFFKQLRVIQNCGHNSSAMIWRIWIHSSYNQSELRLHGHEVAGVVRNHRQITNTLIYKMLQSVSHMRIQTICI